MATHFVRYLHPVHFIPLTYIALATAVSRNSKLFLRFLSSGLKIRFTFADSREHCFEDHIFERKKCDQGA